MYSDPIVIVKSELGEEVAKWCCDMTGGAGHKSPKIMRAVDLLQTICEQDKTNKVIVYSQFEQSLRILGSVLKQKKLICVTVVGSKGVMERRAAFDAFRFRHEVRRCVVCIYMPSNTEKKRRAFA